MKNEPTKSDYSIAIQALKEYASRVRKTHANTTRNSEAWNEGIARDAEDAARRFEHMI